MEQTGACLMLCNYKTRAPAHTMTVVSQWHHRTIGVGCCGQLLDIELAAARKPVLTKLKDLRVGTTQHSLPFTTQGQLQT